MRIAIATDDWEIISTQISGCKGFAIFDLEGSRIKSQEYRSRNFLAQDVTILEDCDILVIKRSEEKLLQEILASHIRIVPTDETLVENVLDHLTSPESILLSSP
ncbi:MAG: hypothetical protein D4R67_09800 [Bacteroidetes bacterium]|nr:MAG: hypothetical protein D4R67_09800 [Bacteroidota bacterium]